jgi:DNA-binding PadR family transcriptional regulator
MRGPSTPLRGALLGLVLERPSHAGELANRLLARLGDTWRINSNDVYRLLEQLEGEGLLLAREEARRGNQRRTRLVYHPSEQTPEAFALWMETLLPREPVRLGLHAKFAVARDEDVRRLLRALEEYELECMQLARMLSASADVRSWKALFMDLTREAVDAQLAAELQWAGRARQRITEYAARE